MQKDFNSFIASTSKTNMLRFSTAGSVDDGKSTLIGRLLHDSKNIYEDHLQSLKKAAGGGEKASLALALVTDGLKDEQEQGITIDVAYRYFSTPKRRFILADTPGHEQYTRNMATGASTADLTIILIDAQSGVVTQTKRHAFIASLLGVPRFLIAINKMDLVGYSEEIFDKIKSDFVEFASRLGVRELRFIPVAALHGDNVVHQSENMPWYQGETLISYLENVYTASDANTVDFRFPVQRAVRPNASYRGYAGQISSGSIRKGEEVVVLPSMRRSKIKSIDVFSDVPSERSITEAFAPMSVTLALEDEIDVGRGDMIVRSQNLPDIKSQFEAIIVWMSDREMDLKRHYLIRHTTRESKVFIDEINYKIDVNTLHRVDAEPLKLNEIGRVSLTATNMLLLDAYQKNRATGNFILIDPDTFQTVAGGMVIDRLPQNFLFADEKSEQRKSQALEPQARVSKDIHLEQGSITRELRQQKSGFKAVTLWCTGLSGSGKSSVAKALERRLFDDGQQVYRLDGDNLRFGLNRDLGFSTEDRSENIRRVAEVARLFNEAGVAVICSFISPYRSDRSAARVIIGAENFVEVFMATPLDVCEARDPHGLYRKARTGEIKDFTGISSPYERPENPEITIDTAKIGLEDSVAELYQYLRKTYK